MAEQFSEQVEILDSLGTATITLNAAKAQADLGGNGQSGDVNLFASDDTSLNVLNAKIRLDADEARMRLGGNGKVGTAALYTDDQILVSNDDRAPILLSASDALVRLGGYGLHGNIRLYADSETATSERLKATVHLNGQTGDVRLGGNDVDGTLRMYQADETLVGDADKTTILLDANTANIRLGGHSKSGYLKLFPATITNVTNDDKASIWLNASDAYLRLGCKDFNGEVALFPSSADLLDKDQATIYLDANNGLLRVGGRGINGDVIVLDENGEERLHLDGATGDIRLQSADVAEQFDVGPTAIAPGTVVAFVDEETVIPATEPYDPRVAGVIAGAGEYHPGMVLGCTARGNRQAVSVFGKACCKVDSSYGSIRAGDLLVVSPTPGHAMRAVDRARAFGAVLGKALRDFDDGIGMIPVLITLR